MTAPAPLASAVQPEVPGDILLPYQKEAITESHRHQLFVSEKSRRTGLTYAFAPDSVLTAAARAKGEDVYYIAYNLDMTREFIGYCADFTKAFDELAGAPTEFLFDDGSEAGIKAFRIDFPSGHAIVALSSKPRSLRGKQGRVIIDEAAFHDSLDELLKAAIALHMWGGSTVVISTHDGEANAFNELIGDIRSGKREGYVQRVTLERAIDEGLYERICLRTGQRYSVEAERAWEAKLRRTYGAAAEEELDVVPAKGSGVYLPRATIEACMSPDCKLVRLELGRLFETAGGLLVPGADEAGITHELRQAARAWREVFIDEWLETEIAPIVATFDPGRRSFFGQDFARSNDLSTIAAGQIEAQSTLVNRLGIEMLGVPFWAQKRILDWLVRALPMWATGKMDARGNGQQLAEDMQEDWGADRIEAVMATQATYLARMPRMKARFDDRTILIPQSDGVADDLRMIKLVKGIPMVVDRVDAKADGAKGQRHGDYSIAVMNLVGAADEDVQPIDLDVIGHVRSEAGDFDVTARGFGTVARRDDFGSARGGW